VQRLSGFGQATVLASNEVVTEAARKAFARVHELEPARPEPRFWLALAKEQDGDLQGAADDLSALLDSASVDAPWREAVAERLQAVSGRLGQAAKDAAPGPSAADITAAAKLPPQQQSEMISQMVEGLAQKLKANGNDLPGWQRLLRSYTVLGQTDKAERALIEARKALAGDGSALSELNAFAKALGLKS
jgi:cytochrome c-type biogenesis protein CcmH